MVSRYFDSEKGLEVAMHFLSDWVVIHASLEQGIRERLTASKFFKGIIQILLSSLRKVKSLKSTIGAICDTNIGSEF